MRPHLVYDLIEKSGTESKRPVDGSISSESALCGGLEAFLEPPRALPAPALEWPLSLSSTWNRIQKANSPRFFLGAPKCRFYKQRMASA